MRGESDRCAGVLVGLAAGDRIGGPIRMAVRLAASLRARGRFDPDDVVMRYLDWWRAGAFDTGPTAARVLELVSAGLPAGDAAARVHVESGGLTAGCNPAHRSAPLAMLAALPDADLPACAAREAALTHADPIAGRVAGVVTGLCRRLIRGADWEAAVREAHAAAGVARTPAEAGPGSSGGFAPDVLRAAVYFVGTSDGFGRALGRSMAFAGPANYGPVLVGAVGGARWGRVAVPAAELAHVGVLPEVEEAAAGLAVGWD